MMDPKNQTIWNSLGLLETNGTVILSMDMFERVLDLARLQSEDGEALAVWYGEMPESNGRSNWTASLHRKGGSIHGQGFCFARSEYPDRVRYEADRMRWIIGELPTKPDILAYDETKHSGYVEPTAAFEHAGPMNRIRVELETISGCAAAVEQDFDALEAAWPQSKRGSRAQKAYDQIKQRWEGVRACVRDALKEVHG